MTRHLLCLTTTAALIASCDTRQPPIGCLVQGVEWVATYKPVGTNTCPELPGERLGIQKYQQKLFIKPQMLNDMDPTDELDPNDVPYASGELPAEADAEGFCTVASLSVAEKHLPEGSAQSLPTDAVYHWSNVRLVALPEVPGTQLIADLEYTADGCTARYEVWAMWPGDLGCADENSPDEPDDSLCQHSESIPPSFAVTCDPSLLLCVPAQRPPSLRSAPTLQQPSPHPPWKAEREQEPAHESPLSEEKAVHAHLQGEISQETSHAGNTAGPVPSRHGPATRQERGPLGRRGAPPPPGNHHMEYF
jgi:hypothetical protein